MKNFLLKLFGFSKYTEIMPVSKEWPELKKSKVKTKKNKKNGK